MHGLWNRRHSTKFNGVSYPVQRGAEAAYSSDGQEQVGELISFYLENARLLREGLQAVGISVFGGINAPYVWLKTPGNVDSWTFFESAWASCSKSSIRCDNDMNARPSRGDAYV